MVIVMLILLLIMKITKIDIDNDKSINDKDII